MNEALLSDILQLTVDTPSGRRTTVICWSGVRGCRNLRLRSEVKRTCLPRVRAASSSAICTRHAPGTTGRPGKCPAKTGWEAWKRTVYSVARVPASVLPFPTRKYKLFSNDIYELNDCGVSVFVYHLNPFGNACFFVHADLYGAKEFPAFSFGNGIYIAVRGDG